jgi:hypothetical protein
VKLERSSSYGIEGADFAAGGAISPAVARAVDRVVDEPRG